MVRWRRKANEFATSSLQRQTEEQAMSRNAVPCDQPAVQGNDFELIPTVQMESRHSVDGPTGRDFSSIYTVRELWGPEVGSRSWFLQKSWFFLEKRPFTGKFSKFCSRRIHRLAHPRLVRKFREIRPTGSRWNRALPTWPKKFRSLSRSRFCTDRIQNLPRPAASNVLRMPQISSKSVHFRRSYSERVNTVETRHKVFPILGEATASSPSNN